MQAADVELQEVNRAQQEMNRAQQEMNRAQSERHFQMAVDDTVWVGELEAALRREEIAETAAFN